MRASIKVVPLLPWVEVISCHHANTFASLRQNHSDRARGVCLAVVHEPALTLDILFIDWESDR